MSIFQRLMNIVIEQDTLSFLFQGEFRGATLFLLFCNERR